MTKPLTARIEVFRPGTFTPMKGNPISYSAGDLKAVADAYDPATAPAPIVIGHPTTDAPAFGWVESFDYDADAERLFANVHEIEPSFAEMVKDGRFKKVSMQYFRPDQAHNPVPGTWYPKHVGFLGAMAPAVSGLKNASFAGDEGVTFEASFGERGFEETASLFRLMRDFFIDRFGLEDADKTLPAWKIDWLGDTEIESRDRFADLPSYSENGGLIIDGTLNGRGIVPDVIPNLKLIPQKEPAVTQQPDPAFAQREAALAAREQALADREQEIAAADNAAFAESLVKDGKLLPASQVKVVALLNEIGTQATVSFAAGDENLTPVDALKQILSEQPQIVSFGAMDLPDTAKSAGTVSFASDGKEVDVAGLAKHEKALAHQRANPGIGYVDAVKAVS